MSRSRKKRSGATRRASPAKAAAARRARGRAKRARPKAAVVSAAAIRRLVSRLPSRPWGLQSDATRAARLREELPEAFSPPAKRKGRA